MNTKKLVRGRVSSGGVRTVDRASPVALYEQIAEILASEIHSKRRKAFERLPSEHEFTEIFGVSRVTVRQAMRKLAGSGLIVARQGKGLFVAGPPVEQELGALRGFYDSLVLQGYQPETAVIDFKRETPSLSIPELKQFDCDIYRFRRLYKIEDVAIVVADVYVPSFGIKLTREDVEQLPVYALIRKVLNRDVVRASVQVRAARTPDDVADLLSIGRNTPVLHMDRTSFDSRGLVLENTRFYIQPEMFAFQLDVAGPLDISSAIRRVNR